MKIVTFNKKSTVAETSIKFDRSVVGLLHENLVYPLEELEMALFGSNNLPDDLLSLIESEDQYQTKLDAMQAAIERGELKDIAQDFESLELLAPLQRPAKICCVALNNKHFEDFILNEHEELSFFLKPSSALVGHGEAVEMYADYGLTHPEPELAVIIGKQGRHIPVNEAMGHVYGYCIHNDITSPSLRVRDYYHFLVPQRNHKGNLQRNSFLRLLVTPHKLLLPWFNKNRPSAKYVFAKWFFKFEENHATYPGKWKGTDTFAPMGPFVATKDEIPDPNNLKVSASIAGSPLVDDHTSNLKYNVAETISTISRYQTLSPGDIISMGTGAKPQTDRLPLFLADINKMGGPLTVSIENLGTLTNPVRQLELPA